MDWVPAHFPKDAFGLYRVSTARPAMSTPIPARASTSEWGTRVFDYGRGEVQSFLISNAMYWLEKYHMDGIRVDAVASMLYLDYGRRGRGMGPQPSTAGKENLEAVDFLQPAQRARSSPPTPKP